MEQQSVRRTRAILTEQQAVEIFKWQSTDEITTMVSSSSFIAKKFGVNERTVRDIWKQRTWAHATWYLGEHTETAPMIKKRMGRPKGSKDIRPRKQKQNSGVSSARPSFYAFETTCDFQQDPVDNSRPQTDTQHPAPVDPLPGTLPRKHVLPIKEESIDDQLHSWTLNNSNWIQYAQTAVQLDCELGIIDNASINILRPASILPT